MDTPASSMEDRALTRPDLLPSVDYPPSVESLATVSAISGTNSALEIEQLRGRLICERGHPRHHPEAQGGQQDPRQCNAKAGRFVGVVGTTSAELNRPRMAP